MDLLISTGLVSLHAVAVDDVIARLDKYQRENARVKSVILQNIKKVKMCN